VIFLPWGYTIGGASAPGRELKAEAQKTVATLQIAAAWRLEKASAFCDRFA
jgi:hypothetical protein